MLEIYTLPSIDGVVRVKGLVIGVFRKLQDHTWHGWDVCMTLS